MCGLRLSPAISPERPQAGEPVLRADLLSFLAAPRKIADRHLHDAASAREHLRRYLVIELEAAGLQSSSFSSARGNSFNAVTVSVRYRPVESQRHQAQAAAAEIRRPRLLRMLAAEQPSRIAASVHDVATADSNASTIGT